MLARGDHRIALYAQKRIAPGEEVTDYRNATRSARSMASRAPPAASAEEAARRRAATTTTTATTTATARRRRARTARRRQRLAEEGEEEEGKEAEKGDGDEGQEGAEAALEGRRGGVGGGGLHAAPQPQLEHGVQGRERAARREIQRKQALPRHLRRERPVARPLCVGGRRAVAPRATPSRWAFNRASRPPRRKRRPTREASARTIPRSVLRSSCCSILYGNRSVELLMSLHTYARSHDAAGRLAVAKPTRSSSKSKTV